MRVLFWNIEHAKADRALTLHQDLVGLARQKPDVMILCEAYNGLDQVLRARPIAGYTVMQPTGPRVAYARTTTLRYVCLMSDSRKTKQGKWRVGVSATLVSAANGKERPGLVVNLQRERVMGVHLPSVTGQVRPQINSLTRILANARTLQLSPSLIVGDLNINFPDGPTSYQRTSQPPPQPFRLVNRFLSELRLAKWKPDPLTAVASQDFTKRTKGVWDKKLDWVVHTAALQQVSVEAMKLKGDPAMNPNIQMGSDGDWEPTFGGVKAADHRPIVCTVL